jgi:hypothetical protein
MAAERENIVAALVTKIGTITTGNGYQQDVGAVLDYPTNFSDIDYSDFPVVSIVLGGETATDNLGSTVDNTLEIGLRCYVDGGDPDTIRTSANKVVEDIKKLIYNNPTLDVSGVILCQVSNVEPPFIWLDVGDVGMVDINLSCLYRQTL